MYGVWYYPQFQASAEGLGTCADKGRMTTVFNNQLLVGGHIFIGSVRQFLWCKYSHGAGKRWTVAH